MLKKILKILAILAGIAVFLIAVLYLIFGRGGEAKEITWGVSFDPAYAESLGLDWKKTYLSILDELKVRRLRLVAFWNAVEPQDDVFDFDRLDFQIKEAEKRDAKVILAIGRRLPRWPECHIPDWAKGLSEADQQQKVLDLLPRIVNRYKNSPAIEYWQVENEPYVVFFGECPGAGAPFVRMITRQLGFIDPSHPILLTDSGELSTWLPISLLGDNLGISIYRRIFEGNYTRRYVNYKYFFPQWYYRIKANFYKKIGLLKDVFVTELQAEPWGQHPIRELSLQEQYITLSPAQLRYNIAFARSTGFDRIYLWGAEWWFYAREKLGVADFVEIVKDLWETQ